MTRTVLVIDGPLDLEEVEDGFCPPSLTVAGEELSIKVAEALGFAENDGREYSLKSPGFRFGRYRFTVESLDE